MNVVTSLLASNIKGSGSARASIILIDEGGVVRVLHADINLLRRVHGLPLISVDFRSSAVDVGCGSPFSMRT